MITAQIGSDLGFLSALTASVLASRGPDLLLARRRLCMTKTFPE
jgi:hypothetical protein